MLWIDDCRVLTVIHYALLAKNNSHPSTVVLAAPRLHWNWLHQDKFAPLPSVKGVRQFDKSADRLSLTQTTKLSKTIFVCHVHLYLQTVMVYCSLTYSKIKALEDLGDGNMDK